MTFATSKKVVGRIPMVALAADIDTCANTYGQGGCAAGKSTPTPTLDMHFAGLSPSLTPRVGTAVFTCTRAGATATRVNESGLIEVVAADTARFDYDPVTLECRGLFAEESRTNLAYLSEQLTSGGDGGWLNSSSTNIVIYSNTDVAPDGTVTADTVSDESGALTGRVQQNRSITSSSNTYCLSWFIKKTTSDTHYAYINVFILGGTAVSRSITVDTNSGAITFSTAVNSGVEDYGDYWRVWMTSADNASGNNTIAFALYPAFNTTGDSASEPSLTGSKVAWGCQVEVGAAPSSYIPTPTTAAVTRNADRILCTDISGFHNVSESTVFVEGEKQYISGATAYPRLFSFSNPSLTNQISSFVIEAEGAARGYVSADSVLQASMHTGAITAGEVFRMAIAYKANDFAASRDGAASVADTSGTMPTVDRMGIGQNGSGGNIFNGHILRLVYWPSRLTNAQLEALSGYGTFDMSAACYNTYKTCQDKANYNKATKTFNFFQPHSNLPIGIEGFPCIVGNPTTTPTRITPDKGLGWRGSISIRMQDFPHHDRGIDPYFATRTYDASSQGTFFGKLKARNPYYKGRLMRLLVGYINDDFSWIDFETRTYVIDKIDGPDGNGRVTISGKDILELADDKRAQIPAPSSGSLSVDYTAGVSTTLVLQSGEGVDYSIDPYTGNSISVIYPGYVRVGDNVLKYTGVSTDTLTGVVGGQFGSTDSDLSIDDQVQLCVYFNSVNVVDILNYVLRNYANIPEEYIPYDAGRDTPTGIDDEWDLEKADWLSANDLTHVITEPTGVNSLIVKLMEQNLIYIWWDEINRKIKLKAIAPALKNESPIAISDTYDIVENSMSVVDDPKDRISQLWVYYDKIDITGDNEPNNYRIWEIQADPDSEGVNAHGEKSVKVIYADWLRSANAGLVVTLAGRLLNRFNETPKTVKFSLDARKNDIWTGDNSILNSRMFQGFDGANVLQKIQILQALEKEPGHLYEYIAQSTVYMLIKYGFVTPDAMNDYLDETDENKASYGFITDDDGLMSNGDNGYYIA
jgi:hypothetical protein